jgi:hypothetical protein
MATWRRHGESLRTVAGVAERCCKACGAWKRATLENFYACEHSRDGLQVRCKPCHIALTTVHVAAYRARRRERRLEQVAAAQQCDARLGQLLRAQSQLLAGEYQPDPLAIGYVPPLGLLVAELNRDGVNWRSEREQAELARTHGAYARWHERRAA